MDMCERNDPAFQLCIDTVGGTTPFHRDFHLSIADYLDPSPEKGKCIVLFPGIMTANGSTCVCVLLMWLSETWER